MIWGSIGPESLIYLITGDNHDCPVSGLNVCEPEIRPHDFFFMGIVAQQFAHCCNWVLKTEPMPQGGMQIL